MNPAMRTHITTGLYRRRREADVAARALLASGVTREQIGLLMSEMTQAREFGWVRNASQEILAPLFEKHMDDIMSGDFSRTMMEDWANDDKNLLTWRAQTAETGFEKAASTAADISEQEYFDHGVLMIAMVKAGVELAFDTMVSAGIKEESAYYESLHEVPLIANTIARKKLYEMNVVISDTAEYGCYLFAHKAVPMLAEFMEEIDTDVIGKGLKLKDNAVDNIQLIGINAAIRYTVVEQVGEELRSYMSAMKPII